MYMYKYFNSFGLIIALTLLFYQEIKFLESVFSN